MSAMNEIRYDNIVSGYLDSLDVLLMKGETKSERKEETKSENCGRRNVVSNCFMKHNGTNTQPYLTYV